MKFLFKKKGKQTVNDVLIKVKTLVECITENFREVLGQNYIDKGIDKSGKAINLRSLLKTTLNQQERLVESKMRLAYANLGIPSLPGNWKSTQQYRVFKRSNLVQYVGYMESMIRNIKGTNYALGREFINQKVDEAKKEIESIDKELTKFNQNSTIDE